MCHIISFENCHFCIDCALGYSVILFQQRGSILWSTVFTAVTAAVVAFARAPFLVSPCFWHTSHMCFKHSPIVSHPEQHIHCDTLSLLSFSKPKISSIMKSLPIYSTWQDHVFLCTALHGLVRRKTHKRVIKKETQNLCTAFVRPLYGIGCDSAWWWMIKKQDRGGDTVSRSLVRHSFSHGALWLVLRILLLSTNATTRYIVYAWNL